MLAGVARRAGERTVRTVTLVVDEEVVRGAARDPSPEVVVRVLGPVEVVGARRPFPRAWCLELVVYLALHPRGVESETWATALWPDALPAGPTRHSTASAARRALGIGAGGRDHLPRSARRLTLAESVTSDWAQFTALSKARGKGAQACWRAALELVRGPLFSGLRCPDWTVLEGFHAEMEDAVVRLALDVAERAFLDGEPETAERAARRAMCVARYDERLYRVLMRAADEQGNSGGIERAMRELVHLLSGGQARCDPGSGGAPSEYRRWVHPETAGLYESLRRGGSARCSGRYGVRW